MKSLLISLPLLILLGIPRTSAQYTKIQFDEEKWRLTVSAGAGWGYLSQGGNLGIAGNLNVGKQYKKIFYNVGTFGISEFNVGSFESSSPSPAVNCFHASASKIYGEGKIAVILGAGIGVVRFLEQGNLIYSSGGLFSRREYERIRVYTVGLPVSATFVGMLDKRLGLCIDAKACLNNKKIFTTLQMGLHFVKMKRLPKNP